MLSLHTSSDKQTSVETRAHLFYPPSSIEGSSQGFLRIMVITISMARALSKDRLSALPDDLILNHILPKISYRDLVCTFSLSRRWQLLRMKISILKFLPADFETQKDGDIQAIISYAVVFAFWRLMSVWMTQRLHLKGR